MSSFGAFHFKINPVQHMRAFGSVHAGVGKRVPGETKLGRRTAGYTVQKVGAGEYAIPEVVPEEVTVV